MLEPEAPGRGFWVGAPSLLDDGDRILLAYRKRRPREGAPPDRGYECRIAASRDGVHFDDIWVVDKAAFDTASMERFCLRRAAAGHYVLYVSYEDPDDGRWRIDAVRAERPDAFDVSTSRPLLTAGGTKTTAVKDPYVMRAGPGYLMLVSMFLTDEGPAPTGLATSRDGLDFSWHGETLGVGTGWDRYQARLSSIVRTGKSYLGFYDGAGSPDEDTEERLGLAVSDDLGHWQRLSVERPWVQSPHASGSLRYVDVLDRGQELWLYYEYARRDGSHELRRSVVSLSSLSSRGTRRGEPPPPAG